jgi:RNA polymerase sigma factor (sigma-70 family)
MEDAQLLREFAANRSETAFRTLTDRYVNLVHSAALRRVGNAQLAEDISQAVFILLARKAGSLSAGTILAGWLYRTTNFVADRALRSNRRRERREMEAVQMQENVSSDSSWQQLAPLLDEALAKLKEAERNAIILRYFQENSLSNVALALGVSEAAAGKRVTRALDALRSHFGRRGFTITTALIAATLAQHAAQGAPANLSAVIAKSLFVHLPATSAVHFTLVRETLQAWRWAKLRWIAAAGVVTVAALFFAASPLSKRSNPSAVPKTSATATANVSSSAMPAPENAPVTAAATTIENTNTFTFWVIDASTGKAVSGARVIAIVAQDPQHMQRFTNLVTDAKGSCAVPLPYPGPPLLAVGIIANGYEERCVMGGGPNPLTNNYVLRLSRGSTISGVVKDESGKPVVGAGIQIQFSGIGDSSEREYQAERPGFPDDEITAATTDDAGRWAFQSAPASNDDFYVEVKHPSFPAASFHSISEGRNYVNSVGRFKLEELHAGTSVFVLASGLGLRGVVTDEQQHPLADAKVSFGEYMDSGSSTKTGVDGVFNLTPLSPGKGHVTITAKGFAPDRLFVEVASNSPTLAIQLKPAARLRLRVVDESGSSKAHVDVRLQAWRGHNTLSWGGLTDDDGKIEWDSAPHDQLNIYAGLQGYFSSRENMITADGEEHTITLHPQVTASGFVTDAETGQPIAAFKAIPGSERLELVHGINGEYTLTFQEFSQPLEIHFEADGYEPATSDPLAPNRTTQTVNLSLKRQKSSVAIHGIVLLPDGSPAAGAQVALCTAEKGVTLESGHFARHEDSIITTADASGHFAFAADPAPQRVIAVDDHGFVQLPVGTNHNLSLALKPWGRIEGVLKLRTEKNSARQINFMHRPAGPARGVFRVTLSADTDAQGNFVFERAPAGDFDLYLFPGMYRPFTHQTPVQVEPGKTVSVQIGGTGGIVTGKFESSDPSRPINWPKQIWNDSIVTQLPPPPVPPDLTGDARRQWTQAYWKSEAGMAIARTMRSYPLTVGADGSFTAEDVPPGTYLLSAMISSVMLEDGDIQTAVRTPTLGSVRQEIVVPDSAANPTSDPLNLGTVIVRLK